MTLSTSPRAYDDCHAVMTAALLDESGARVKLPSMDAAIYFRMRCNQARAIDRRLNADTYDKGHPMHNASEFDRLTFRLEEDTDGVWLRMEQNRIIPGEVQSLSSNEVIQMELPLAPPPRALPPPKSPSVEEMAEAFAEIEAVDGEVLPPSKPKTGIRRV